MTCVALFLCGIGSWLSFGLSLAVVALIGFLKEYLFDPTAIEGNEPDIKDALWTILGGIEAFIAMATIYVMIMWTRYNKKYKVKIRWKKNSVTN